MRPWGSRTPGCWQESWLLAWLCLAPCVTWDPLPTLSGPIPPSKVTRLDRVVLESLLVLQM